MQTPSAEGLGWDLDRAVACHMCVQCSRAIAKAKRCKNCGLRGVFNTLRLHGIAIHIGERVGDAPHKRVVRHPSAKILRHLTRQALPFAWHRVAGVLIKLIDATDVEDDCAWQWLCGPACFWSYVFRKFA